MCCLSKPSQEAYKVVDEPGGCPQPCNFGESHGDLAADLARFVQPTTRVGVSIAQARFWKASPDRR